MNITAEISMYPLEEDFIPPITSFIHRLGSSSGLEVVTNQMSTQVRGSFADVTTAINDCMKESMSGTSKMAIVVKYLNSDLEISGPPDLG